jgi:hypothetical protein
MPLGLGEPDRQVRSRLEREQGRNRQPGSHGAVPACRQPRPSRATPARLQPPAAPPPPQGIACCLAWVVVVVGMASSQCRGPKKKHGPLVTPWPGRAASVPIITCSPCEGHADTSGCRCFNRRWHGTATSAQGAPWCSVTIGGCEQGRGSKGGGRLGPPSDRAPAAVPGEAARDTRLVPGTGGMVRTAAPLHPAEQDGVPPAPIARGGWPGRAVWQLPGLRCGGRRQGGGARVPSGRFHVATRCTATPAPRARRVGSRSPRRWGAVCEACTGPHSSRSDAVCPAAHG